LSDRRNDPDHIAQLYRDGLSFKAIQKQTGVYPKKTRRILEAHGVPIRGDQEGTSLFRAKRREEWRQEALRLQQEECLNKQQIAERMGIGYSTMRDLIPGLPYTSPKRLTPQQQNLRKQADRVLAMYRSGQGYSTIGRALGFDEKTVKHFLLSIGEPRNNPDRRTQRRVAKGPASAPKRRLFARQPGSDLVRASMMGVSLEDKAADRLRYHGPVWPRRVEEGVRKTDPLYDHWFVHGKYMTVEEMVQKAGLA
jgi:hypothetical protein